MEINVKENSKLPQPTARELEVMQVLWKLEEASVREVLNHLNEGRPEPYAYTTILRFFQIMHEKGLVLRKEGQRGHVYRASTSPERTKRQMAADFMDRVFSGSVRDLMLHALGSKSVSADELKEIRQLVDQLQKKGKQS